ncbi:hypothetical protein CAP39_01160 [Sphingomonas sp. IBVSS1]|nr:hypothetical protein CAP39_01160 [Sphingomonas sp. IBVSS1]
MNDQSRHEFGGAWTEVKLAAISAYSRFFTSAIGSKFDLWYVDPFAGTGERVEIATAGGLLEGTPISEIERRYPGSASRALMQVPAFNHYRFGDSKKAHVDALNDLCRKFPEIDAKVISQDANKFIQSMFSHKFWRSDDFSFGTPRALVFLDPYGLEVKWATLCALAECQKADVWLLANLGGAVRQLCHDHSKLDESKRKSLSEYFGTTDWEQEFYDVQSGVDMFGDLFANKSRKASKADVAAFHRMRLETLFKGYVSDPLPLAVGNVDDYFLLYCMSNNPHPKACALIKKGADWVINSYKRASRHKFSL